MPASSKERLVVVGNGMAGIRTIELLLAHARCRYEITVVGAEPHPDDASLDQIVTHSRSWYAQHCVRLIAGDPAVAIDRAARTVVSAGGAVIRYDQLLLATGSKPVTPPISGRGLRGVCGFRRITDVQTMIAAARREKRAVVIGGGLLGLEAAWGLKRRGMDVTVVHLMPNLMERQLDPAAAALLQRDLEKRGIAFVVNAQTEKILGSEHVRSVRLADGRELPADLVVLAIGIRPNVDLARDAGVDIERGIVVGDDLRTNDPAIYAVGECAEHNGRLYGLVAPLWEQASVCAARLAGDERASFTPPPLFTSLKITGLDVFSAGELAAVDPADEEVILYDPDGGVYRKLILRNDTVVGSVLYGAVADGPWYVQLMREQADVARLRDRLAFGRVYTENAGIAMVRKAA